MDIDDVRPAEDPYEYAIQVTRDGNDVVEIDEYSWESDKKVVQKVLDRKTTGWEAYGVEYTAKLVKRRKAGLVEEVEVN